jgi:tetratricopeptide (TPR) repeat protein
MFSDTLFERGRVLYAQSRYQQALSEFQQVLAQDPGHLDALLYQALSLLELGRHADALEAANSMIRQQPDNGYALHLKAKILIQLDRDAEAETLVHEALSHEPEEAMFWGTLALLAFDRRAFDAALGFADCGLALDPTNSVCLNVRTLSLTKLGRPDEAARSIEETLAEDPDDAFSHASAGWAYLEAGRHQQARYHFGEALRLSPDNDWAKAGMLQALKAKNGVYRLFLTYYFWMANHQKNGQWAFLIGFYVLFRLLRGLAAQYPIFYVVVVPLFLFAISTWIMEPLFNLLLSFDPQGRYALSQRQRRGSIWVMACLGGAIGFGLLALVWPGSLLLAIFSFLMMLPVSGLFGMEQPRNIRIMTIYTAVMGAAGALSLAGMFLDIDALMPAIWVFFLGTLASGWVINYLNINRGG